ncbi:MAG: hypothetical protein JKY34_10225 [Kordiimonadaceae bacterium]|nr:hypothetical protein [Kordiimonadaceae bacterium]
MTHLFDVLKKPTLSTIEVTESKVTQRIYSIEKAERDKRLLIGFGVFTLLSVILILLGFTFGMLFFLLSAVGYDRLKAKKAPQKDELLSEVSMDTPPYFHPVKKDVSDNEEHGHY